MKPLQFVSAESTTQASSILASNGHKAHVISGGTDLLGEIKEGVVIPETLVSLAAITELRGISSTPQGTRIGAMTTLGEIESFDSIANEYPVLSQAVASVATPQIRNVGTLGGNLCQRPRCWYYRSPLFDCRKKGGQDCFAIEDGNKFHAILGGSGCYIVHPSDLAVALISLRATVSIVSGSSSSEIPLEGFFIGPEKDILRENILKPGEFVASVFVPKAVEGHRSVYLKAKERQAMDFALSSVALSVNVVDGVIQDARLVLGGVAPTPFIVSEAEDKLIGKSVTEVDAQDVGRQAVKDARPLRDNQYKVRLTAALVARAIYNIVGDSQD